MTNSAAYEGAKLIKAEAETEHKNATARLKEVSGTEKGAFGLTPDHIKQSPEWQDAYSNERQAFARLRKVNAWMTANFAAEMKAERKAKGR